MLHFSFIKGLILCSIAAAATLAIAAFGTRVFGPILTSSLSLSSSWLPPLLLCSCCRFLLGASFQFLFPRLVCFYGSPTFCTFHLPSSSLLAPPLPTTVLSVQRPFSLSVSFAFKLAELAAAATTTVLLKDLKAAY